MKKLILMMMSMIMLVTMVTGCSSNNTKTEEDLINRANSLIEAKYAIKIDKASYTYELGEVLEQDKFVDIKEGVTPERVFLRAMYKGKPSRGEVLNYAIEFNTVTNEMINSECEVY